MTSGSPFLPQRGEGERGRSLQCRCSASKTSGTANFIFCSCPTELTNPWEAAEVGESIAWDAVLTPGPWCFPSSHRSHNNDGNFCRVLRPLAMISLMAPLGLRSDGRNHPCLSFHPYLVHSFPWWLSLLLLEVQFVPPQFSWNRKNQFADRQIWSHSNEASQQLN